MPQWSVRHNPEGTTLEEFRKLLEIRRQALAEATIPHGMGRPLPVAWRHGWKAHLRLRGRDKDHSLKATIVVEGPRGEIAYARNVRLVSRQPLPYELGRTLRES